MRHYIATDLSGRTHLAPDIDFTHDPVPALNDQVPVLEAVVLNLALLPVAWPCRVFEVESDGRTYSNGPFSLQKQLLRVTKVTEVDAHQVFGPQWRDVKSLLERVETMTEDQFRALEKATPRHENTPGNNAWVQATWTVWSGAMETGREWGADAAVTAVTLPAEMRQWSDEDTESPLVEVALAVMMSDMLDRKDYETLMAPWVKVMGEETA